MITAIEIDNFKCFSKVRIPLGPLTLFTGFNGGGKSTALQPLLLLAQALRHGSRPTRIALNGSLVRLGAISDVVPAGSNATTIRFGIQSEADSFEWLLQARTGERYLSVANAGAMAPRDTNDLDSSSDQGGELTRIGSLEEALQDLVFISAVREGPADGFPIPDTDRTRGDVGFDGRFAAYWYERCADELVDVARCHRSEPATSVRKQLDAWLSSLFSGAQANAFAVPHTSLVALQFRLSNIGEWRRPANVGYGFTYVFPILVALLTAAKGQVIVIDSPEAHLHPSAQSQMGQMLAHFATAGVQVVVETHSDHLLNGARVAVKLGAIDRNAFKVHFFAGATARGHGIISPSVDVDGRIDEWPSGFFDQAEADLARLAGWD